MNAPANLENMQAAPAAVSLPDLLRHDFVCEMADDFLLKAIAMRDAYRDGEMEHGDILFECLSLIGREIRRTRLEMKTGGAE